MKLHRRILLALVIGLGSTMPLRAAPKETEYTEEQFKAYDKLVAEVAASLLGKMQRVPGCNYWPPIVKFLNDEDVRVDLRGNAYATFDNTYEESMKGENLNPLVVVTTGWMKKIEGNKDALAWVIGHELGHLHHKHPCDAPGPTKLLNLALRRKQEAEADDFGAAKMLEAGFSMQKAMIGNIRMLEKRHEGSIGALTSTHPDWRDRFEKISGDPKYWRSMSAFTNGVVLLNTEQYAAAEFCFDRVLEEFPKCYEALVNVGYACLMQYCDGLSAADFKKYDVGQVVCGGFYQRAKSLEPPVRTVNGPLWNKAVSSFRAALKLKPDLALAKANLGLAYLFHPAGKQSDKAMEFLQSAVAALEADKTLDPLTRAATLVNLGAAQLAEGDRKEGLAMLDKAVLLAKEIKGGQAKMVRGAISYQQAMARSDTKDADSLKQAADQFEQYLKTSDPLSAWWKLGFERYVDLCKAIKREPNTEASFKRGLASELRAPAGLILEGGLKVTLGEPIADVLKRLGPAKETPVAGPALKRYSFEKYGIDILGGDQVIAIILPSKSLQSFALQTSGIGGAKVIELKIGTSQTEMAKNGLGYENGACISRELLAPDIYYHYYRHLGVALRYDEHPSGKISELMLVRIPD